MGGWRDVGYRHGSMEYNGWDEIGWVSEYVKGRVDGWMLGVVMEEWISGLMG